MARIILSENQYKRLFMEVNAPNFENGDISEFPGTSEITVGGSSIYGQDGEYSEYPQSPFAQKVDAEEKGEPNPKEDGSNPIAGTMSTLGYRRTRW